MTNIDIFNTCVEKIKEKYPNNPGFLTDIFVYIKKDIKNFKNNVDIKVEHKEKFENDYFKYEKLTRLELGYLCTYYDTILNRSIYNESFVTLNSEEIIMILNKKKNEIPRLITMKKHSLLITFCILYLLTTIFHINLLETIISDCEVTSFCSGKRDNSWEESKEEFKSSSIFDNENMNPRFIDYMKEKIASDEGRFITESERLCKYNEFNNTQENIELLNKGFEQKYESETAYPTSDQLFSNTKTLNTAVSNDPNIIQTNVYNAQEFASRATFKKGMDCAEYMSSNFQNDIGKK